MTSGIVTLFFDKITLCNIFYKILNKLTETKAPKPLSTNRTGFRKLTFHCTFPMNITSDVSWFYYSDYEGNPTSKTSTTFNLKESTLTSHLTVVSLLTFCLLKHVWLRQKVKTFVMILFEFFANKLNKIT